MEFDKNEDVFKHVKRVMMDLDYGEVPFKTIEGLVGYKLELTEYGIKESGL